MQGLIPADRPRRRWRLPLLPLRRLAVAGRHILSLALRACRELPYSLGLDRLGAPGEREKPAGLFFFFNQLLLVVRRDDETHVM